MSRTIDLLADPDRLFESRLDQTLGTLERDLGKIVKVETMTDSTRGHSSGDDSLVNNALLNVLKRKLLLVAFLSDLHMHIDRSALKHTVNQCSEKGADLKVGWDRLVPKADRTKSGWSFHSASTRPVAS